MKAGVYVGLHFNAPRADSFKFTGIYAREVLLHSDTAPLVYFFTMLAQLGFRNQVKKFLGNFFPAFWAPAILPYLNPVQRRIDLIHPLLERLHDGEPVTHRRCFIG